jgi:hypothetical protein
MEETHSFLCNLYKPLNLNLILNKPTNNIIVYLDIQLNTLKKKKKNFSKFAWTHFNQNSWHFHSNWSSTKRLACLFFLSLYYWREHARWVSFICNYLAHSQYSSKYLALYCVSYSLLSLLPTNIFIQFRKFFLVFPTF